MRHYLRYALAGLVWLQTLCFFGVGENDAFAVALDGPYRSIALSNAFHILTPAIQPPEAKPPPKPLPIVSLTGITDVGGKRRALLEILRPGQPVKRPVLGEGEELESVEVLLIDVSLSRVKVRIQGLESILAFEPAKTAVGGMSSGPVDQPPLPRKPL